MSQTRLFRFSKVVLFLLLIASVSESWTARNSVYNYTNLNFIFGIQGDSSASTANAYNENSNSGGDIPGNNVLHVPNTVYGGGEKIITVSDSIGESDKPFEGFPWTQAASRAEESLQIPNIPTKFIVEYLKTFLSSLTNRINVSEDCRESVRYLVNGETNQSLLFLDANAKIPAGVLGGTIAFLGSFDQCLAIEVVPASGSNFVGQYCSLLFKPKNPDVIKNLMKQFGDGSVKPASTLIHLRFDVCIPSTCSDDDVKMVLAQAGETELLKSTNIIPQLNHCQTKQRKPLDSGQITAVSIFTVLGLIVLTGTILDISKRMADHFLKDVTSVSSLCTKMERSKVFAAFVSFSLFTNWTKLINTSSGHDSLTAINGIRFLSMSWVILGHCYFFINLNLIGNLRNTQKVVNDFAFQAILNGTVSVDSFFLLSGLLVSYVAVRELRKNGKINWALFYFHRIWRLSPAYGLIILVMLLYPLLGSGPFWYDSSGAWVANCRTNWWVNMLYINNVYKRDQMCMGHAWYLANDMQFYIISPIILYLLYKWPKVGLSVILVMILGSIAATAAIGAYYNMPATTLFLDPDLDSRAFMSLVYIVPWCRIGPYLVGLLVGFFLAINRQPTISMRVQILCWCLAVASNMSVLYGVYWWHQGTKTGKAINAFYLSTHRIVWAIGVGWLAYACSTGHGGIVNRILSWKLFVPLGRLTYMAYLLHPVVQIGYTGTVRERLMYTHYAWVNMFFGFMCMSYGFAVPATLCFETPFLALEKILLGRGHAAAQTTKKPEGQINGAFQEDPPNVKQKKDNI